MAKKAPREHRSLGSITLKFNLVDLTDPDDYEPGDEVPFEPSVLNVEVVEASMIFGHAKQIVDQDEELGLEEGNDWVGQLVFDKVKEHFKTMKARA